MVSEEQIRLMRERITDEVFFALLKKKNGLLRRWLGELVSVPTTRFARIFAAADERAANEGLPGAGDSLARSLEVSVSTRGLEGIPSDGPLLIVSNHPGAYDSALLCSCISRPDLKIIVSDVPFYRAFPHISRQMIFVAGDPPGRMLALRSAVEHLQGGGAILQFGTGKIDPDPEVQPGAEAALAKWLPSIEVMLRKAPLTSLVLAIASGVVQRRFINHPLARMHRDEMDRRRLAEFLQIIQQLIRPGSVRARASASFSAPISRDELAADSADRHLMLPILSRAKVLLVRHMQQIT